jgi:hypothetical protein
MATCLSLAKGLLGGFNSHIYCNLLTNIVFYYNYGVCVRFLALIWGFFIGFFYLVQGSFYMPS